MPVRMIPNPVKYISDGCKDGKIASPPMMDAIKNKTGKNALPPKISLTAIWYSRIFAEAMPVDISGNAVHNAKIVPPNNTPLIPKRLDNTSLVISSAQPDNKVTSAQIIKTVMAIDILPFHFDFG